MRDEERMWRMKEMKKHEERMGERLRRRKEGREEFNVANEGDCCCLLRRRKEGREEFNVANEGDCCCLLRRRKEGREEVNVDNAGDCCCLSIA